jgi:LCP family protein required for cell wall assembly
VAVLTITGVGWSLVHKVVGSFAISHALGAIAGPPGDARGPVNILLMGLDSRLDQQGNPLPKDILDRLHAGDSDSGGYNTNTLILAHITPDDHVVAYSIPRDDYVAVDNIPGYHHIKIKEAYGLKKAYAEQKLNDSGVTDPAELEQAGREAGRKATLAAVRDLTGVKIDYFAEVSLSGFYDLASALGGVDVCLNQAVEDEAYSGADFPAGPQTLQGAQALAFVRQRHGLTNGDLDRTHRQQAFLVSVLHKLQSGGVFSDVSKLGPLISLARKDITLSDGWSLDLIQRLGSVKGADVQYRTLPVVRYDTVNDQAVNIVDADAIKAEVTAAFSGNAAEAAAVQADSTGGSSTVDVINAGPIDGLAVKVAAVLSGQGFTTADVRNRAEDEPADTQVDYGPGAAGDAQRIADLLRTGPPPQLDNSEPTGRIRVILGPQYDPPAVVTDPGAGTAHGDRQAAAVSDAATPSQGKPVSGATVPCVD